MTLPVLTFDAELLLRAQGIRVVFLDVDGVLTDGGLYCSEAGEVFKRFHVLDGHGLKLLRTADITPVIITGRDSTSVRARVKELGIQHAHFGVGNKYLVAEQALDSLELTWGQAATMGDDWPDAALLKRSALACVPPHGHAEVRALAHYITQAPGGNGAVRELCDLLLMASGRYAQHWQAALE